jgi:hypothetical protein
MHLYFVNITVMQGLCIKNRLFFLYGFSIASSVKSHEKIAYFFFPRVFGITCGFADLIVGKHKKLWDLAGLHLGYSHDWAE